MNDLIAKYQKLLEQYPNNELARFSLGKAHFDAGQFAEAKTHLQQALARKPDWMVVQILIGKCEMSLGQRAAAKKSFETALKLAIDQHHEGPQAELEQLLEALA